MSQVSDIKLYFRTYNSMLACAMGVRESLIFGQVYYWLRVYSDNPKEHAEKHFVNGKWWTFNPIETKKEGCHDWAEQFPEMSPSTIKNTLTKFTKQGLLIKGNFNKMKGDQTLWYTIDFDALYEKYPFAEELFPRVKEPLVKNCQMVVDKTCLMEQTKIAKPIPNNTTKSSIPDKEEYREFSAQRKNSMYLSPTEFANLLDDAYSEIAGTDVSQATRMQLANIAEYFAEHYNILYGRNVPKISKQAALKAIKNLLYSEIEVSYGEHLGTECWDLSEHSTQDVYGMIDGYFDTRFEADHSFCHFCSEGVIVRRWLEYRRNSFYRESDEELPFD